MVTLPTFFHNIYAKYFEKNYAPKFREGFAISKIPSFTAISH